MGDLHRHARFLANPHYEPALAKLTGRDPAVAARIDADPAFAPFFAALTGMIEPLLPRFVAEGRSYLTIAIGCTGGRHRSVFLTEAVANALVHEGYKAKVSHRDIGR